LRRGRARALSLLCTLAILLAALPPWRACAQEDAEQEDSAGRSRPMQTAIELFEKGRDLEAMDRFMDILVKGDPAERPIANEYLNRITQRMSSMTGNPEHRKPAEEKGEVVSTVRQKRSPKPEPEEEEPGAPPAELSNARKEDAASSSAKDRADMKREIETRIQDRVRASLQKLRRYEDLRILMANPRLPRAIAIPPSLLFDSGIQFKKDAGKILSSLSELLFALGATQAVLLPEGAVSGSAKILDMRRSMGISAHFYRTGIAPARIRVNLLSSQVNVPAEVQDFKGIILLFLYNNPLSLSADSVLDDGGGPPLSLGASPSSFDPHEDAGSILEFSVSAPPAGLHSWRFQLLGPGERPEDDLVLIQEVRGVSPVFHQIFWNGRRNYSGAMLPPGQYEAVLTAADHKNRMRKKHLWLTLQSAASSAPEPQYQESAPDKEAPQARAPARSAARAKLPGKTVSSSSRRRTAPRAPAKPAQPRSEEESSEGSPPAAPEEKKPATAPKAPDSAQKPTPPAEASPSRAGAVNFQVAFPEGSAEMSQDSDSVLGHVAETMELYPLDKINLVGYAYSGETDAAALAPRRAELVKKKLVEQYRMRPENIQTRSQVSGSQTYKVEIYIVRGG